MAGKGYIKLYRKILDNPIVCKDAEHLAIWIWLLCHATHSDKEITYGGKRMTLKPGQLRVSRKTIADDLHISESKVQRVLKLFENEQQIEQQTNFHDRVISICSWSEYQASEQQFEQQVNSYRTASEQQVNANNNDKELKNDNKLKNYCSSKEPLWKRLSSEELQKIEITFEDPDELIAQCSIDVRDKDKDVYDAFRYIVGYAEKRGWPRCS